MAARGAAAGIQAAVLAAAAVLIWAVFERARLDRTITAPFYDPAAGAFPLQHAWLLTAVAHDALKWAVLAFWAACATVALLPVPRWVALRPLAARGAIGMLAVALVVTALKQASAHSCPWDLQDYGGAAQWFALFQAPPDHAGPGRCLPAGHPATGFSLFAWYFALCAARPRVARIVLAAAWVLGLAAGAAQVARGAHFVSHVLWTAWLAWTVTWTMDLAMRRMPARASPAGA